MLAKIELLVLLATTKTQVTAYFYHGIDKTVLPVSFLEWAPPTCEKIHQLYSEITLKNETMLYVELVPQLQIAQIVTLTEANKLTKWTVSTQDGIIFAQVLDKAIFIAKYQLKNFGFCLTKKVIEEIFQH